MHFAFCCHTLFWNSVTHSTTEKRLKSCECTRIKESFQLSSLFLTIFNVLPALSNSGFIKNEMMAFVVMTSELMKRILSALACSHNP